MNRSIPVKNRLSLWLRCYLIIISFAAVSCDSETNPNSDSTATPAHPNFVFVLADDQGWNGTSVQMMDAEPLSKSDYMETPNLERLARQGARFSHAYSAAPVCAPSRYGIQFGKTPARLSLIRVGMNSDHIDHAKYVSIPKALKGLDSNYVAGHFGKWGIGSNPDVLGYDVSDGPTQNREGGFKNDKSQWDPKSKNDPKHIFDLTNRAIAFMSENANRPFYLQISHYAVHADIEAQPATLEKYNSKQPGLRQKNPGFAAMTEDLDQGFGKLLDAIDSLELAENTYVIYMSDNGSVPNIPGAKKYDESYNYPLSRGKWDAMEGGIRVPLVIRGPGIAPGMESKVPVSGTDILPTIVDLAGRGTLDFEAIDGGSFSQVLLNNQLGAIERPVSGLFFHVPYRNGIALKRPHSALRIGDFKLLKFQDNDESLLFDLAADIGENRDVSKENPDKSAEMLTVLEDYLKEVHAPKWEEGITWKKKPLAEINSQY
ncbi:MAG: sulfatase [Crocinitomicaceae bacterium]|jgi:arylsulfatase A-like enzyme|nr:sulfatase [Crocinitomicaceae bacterium]